MTARTTRRVPMLAAGIVTVALALTGCVAGDAPDSVATSTSDASSSLLPAAEGETTYPLTLTTAWGESQLAQRPERIVTLGLTDTELLAALGAIPVAAWSIGVERSVWTQNAIDTTNIEIVEETDDHEAIAAAEPDLIVVSGTDLTDSYERYSTIAPVLAAETVEETESRGGDWRSQILAIGEALDLVDAARTATAEYDAHITTTKADNPEFEGVRLAFLIHYGEEYGTWYSSVEGTSTYELFDALGFDVSTPDGITDAEQISAELLPLIDSEVLLLNSQVDVETTQQQLTGTELFQQLPAVQAGQWSVFYHNESGDGFIFDGVEHEGNIAWATAHGGALLGKAWAVDQLVPVLRAALNLD